MKTINKELDEYNKERIIDINLTLQYIKSLDIEKEYFTDIGIGHLRGLASLKDELKFISIHKYNDLQQKYNNIQSKLMLTSKENKKLKEEIEQLKSKKWWNKWLNV